MDTPSMVEIAAKQRHVMLLKKVRNNQPLTAGELRELQEYEAFMAKKKTKTTKKKPASKSESTAAPPRRSKKATAVELKNWAMRYVDIPDAETGEGLTWSLAAHLKRSKTYLAAWQRGQFLRKLRVAGGWKFKTNVIERELGMEPGQMTEILAADDEAREVYNHARFAELDRAEKALDEKIDKGQVTVTALERMIQLLRTTVARSDIDEEHVPTELMEKLFDVTRQALHKWVTEFGAPINAVSEGRKNTYPLPAFIKWFERFTLEKASRQPGKFIPQQNEKDRLQSEKLRLQIGQIDKTLVNVDRSVASFVARGAVLNQFIQTNAPKLALEIIGASEKKVKKDLGDFFEKLREAACHVPSDYYTLLPDAVAEKFKELIEILKTIKNGES